VPVTVRDGAQRMREQVRGLAIRQPAPASHVRVQVLAEAAAARRGALQHVRRRRADHHLDGRVDVRVWTHRGERQQ